MERDEHSARVKAWVKSGQSVDLDIIQYRHDVRNAVFVLDQLHAWPDSVDSVSVEQVLFCWQLIERLRSQKFPEELRM